MPRHPPHALHSLSHTPPTQPPPQTPQQHRDTTTAGTRQAMHTTAIKKIMTCHKEPTHPPQSRRACHNKQNNQTHHTPTKNMGIHGSERCSRPLSRSQTTTPHHPEPTPTGTGRRSRVPRSLVPKPQTPRHRASLVTKPQTTPPDPDDPTGTSSEPGVRLAAGGLILQNPNSVSVSNPVRDGPAAADPPQRAPPSPSRAALNGRVVWFVSTSSKDTTNARTRTVLVWVCAP